MWLWFQVPTWSRLACLWIIELGSGIMSFLICLLALMIRNFVELGRLFCGIFSPKHLQTHLWILNSSVIGLVSALCVLKESKLYHWTYIYNVIMWFLIGYAPTVFFWELNLLLQCGFITSKTWFYNSQYEYVWNLGFICSVESMFSCRNNIFLLWSDESCWQVLDLDLKSTCLFKERWSMLTCCQIASTFGFLQCKKSLTGGFSSLEISFSFPLSTALNAGVFVDNLYRRPNAILFWGSLTISSTLLWVSIL